METKYIIYFKIWLLLVIFGVNSCTSTPVPNETNVEEGTDSSEDEHLIARKWILSDNLTSDSPTMVIMSLEKNGYFIIYDTIIDPKFTAAGINKIQPISKGQWKFENNKLNLNHLLPESSKPEIFEVTTLSPTKLITKGSNNKTHKYIIQ